MFNIQGSEIIIVLLLALVVLGPEKLPDAMRKMGQAYAELKKMSSGFQNEFRAAIDEPMREIRDTANVLRDSADFTKLQSGERDEKPKSGEMAPADPDTVPTDDIPTFDTSADDASAAGPEPAADSKPAPYSGQSSAAPRPANDPAPAAGDGGSGSESAADDSPEAVEPAPRPGRTAVPPTPFPLLKMSAPRATADDEGAAPDADTDPPGGAVDDAADHDPDTDATR